MKDMWMIKELMDRMSFIRELFACQVFPTFINRDEYMKLYWGLNVMHQDDQNFIVAEHVEVKIF